MAIHMKCRPGVLEKTLAHRLRARAKRLSRLLDIESQELSFLYTTDQEMAELNRIYRGISKTTDVLAFSQVEGERPELHQTMLGDVVISVPTAIRQAKRHKIDAIQEITLLMIHGVLHLLGYEHVGVAPEESRVMRNEQTRLLAILETSAKRKDQILKRSETAT